MNKSKLCVVYHRSTNESAKALASALDIKATKEPNPDDVIAVRYGSSTVVPCRDVSLNRACEIRLSADGYRSLEVLNQEGVSSVEVYRSAPSNPDVYPLIGRKRINHRGGSDIVFIETIEQVSDYLCKYYTRYYNADRELRLHVFDDQVIKVFRKVPRAEDADQIIKSSQKGWGYRKVNHHKYYFNAQEMAKEAIREIGLVWGAVDIGCKTDGWHYKVFEVNSGPGLNSLTLELYVGKFREHLRSCGFDV